MRVCACTQIIVPCSNGCETSADTTTGSVGQPSGCGSKNQFSVQPIGIDIVCSRCESMLPMDNKNCDCSRSVGSVATSIDPARLTFHNCPRLPSASRR